ncbi:hypothetical protein B0H17DRAFT_1134522 [Mycena rosella]|uniref:Glycosyltransferase family 90 protein n=1 Tax=Mycena rosella TaxID=1033263 RepID=A0AAD7GE69_MYCRO|nr:hypothetical protein B0H17DRAFT_1134522 [Mycena rosella]
MSYNPESTVARPLLVLAWPRRPRPTPRTAATGSAAASARSSSSQPAHSPSSPSLPSSPPPSASPSPPARQRAPPPGGQPTHPHNPPPAHPNGHAPLDRPPSSSSPFSDDAEHAVAALYAVQPRTLAAAHARYALKTGQAPPTGYNQFFAFAREWQCLVDAYNGVHADFLPLWRAEHARAQRGWFRESVRRVEELGGEAHLPGYQGTYFDGAWETTINKFASALSPLTVLINDRNEPRVFDTLPLFEGAACLLLVPYPSQIPALTALHDHTPFALVLPSTHTFFTPLPGCGRERRVDGVPFLLSASSAEFMTGLVPVLSMARIAGLGDRVPAPGSGSFSSSSDSNATFNSSTGEVGGEGDAEGECGHMCFADVLVPGEFYYHTSWWAGQFAYLDRTRRGCYWRSKSNGGHICGTNFRSFPRFWLLDLAAHPESVVRGLFDIRVRRGHKGCRAAPIWIENEIKYANARTDDCDVEPIKVAYNISEDAAPREEVYGFKYLLDVDGNTFSGRCLGLLRSGGLVFESTSFTEWSKQFTGADTDGSRMSVHPDVFSLA